MAPRRRYADIHERSGWLRAAVLGADDGIVSTAALMIGVAASNASRAAILTAGIAGLVAGAASMAAGEYVSVSSQRDLERAAGDAEHVAQARPVQAAVASATSFTTGALVPLLGLFGGTETIRLVLIVVLSLAALAGCGALAAEVGGAPPLRAAVRVLIGGGVAMAVSALVGRIVGAVV
jgi:VIT1/CCC1 family predicted Fe2+/Mn2+ transporter